MSQDTSAKVVDSRQELAQFVERLAQQCETFENNILRTYLLAAAAWIQDMDGYYQNQGLPIPEQPSWKTIADILEAASMYE